MRTIWTQKPTARASGSAASPDGLIATLRGIEIGHEVLASGMNAVQVGNHIRAARRGSDRWYEARTVATGALVRRVE